MISLRDMHPRLAVLSVGRRVRFRHLRRAVAVAHPVSILDAGCGSGQHTWWLARRFPEASVLSIDSDEAGVRETARRLRRRSDAEARVAIIGGVGLHRRFDLVVCTDVLEHLVDDEAGLTWLVEHLEPGGTLVLHVPALHQPHPLTSIEDKMLAEVDAARGPHFREGYGVDNLAARVECLGLEVLQASSTFHSPLLWWAVDIDQWLQLTGRRATKICVRPFLLAAASLERQPKRGRRGHGVLLVGRRDSA